MRPFLHLATRDLDVAAHDEYEAILEASGLTRDELIHVRTDAGPLPEIGLEDYSGVFLGGSPFNVSDAEKDATQLRVERELGAIVNHAVAGRLPMLGLCYGIGVITQHLGGVMDRRFGEESSAVEVTLTDAGREDPIFGQLADRFWVCTGHKEACSTLPPGAVNLITREACPVQAIRVGESCYATQFHAELTAEQIIARMVLYRDIGYFPADQLEVIAAQVRAAGVAEWPRMIVRGFTERFARD